MTSEHNKKTYLLYWSIFWCKNNFSWLFFTKFHKSQMFIKMYKNCLMGINTNDVLKWFYIDPISTLCYIHKINVLHWYLYVVLLWLFVYKRKFVDASLEAILKTSKMTLISKSCMKVWIIITTWFNVIKRFQLIN